jgi:hypothetical protein
MANNVSSLQRIESKELIKVFPFVYVSLDSLCQYRRWNISLMIQKKKMFVPNYRRSVTRFSVSKEMTSRTGRGEISSFIMNDKPSFLLIITFQYSFVFLCYCFYTSHTKF